MFDFTRPYVEFVDWLARENTPFTIKDVRDHYQPLGTFRLQVISMAVYMADTLKDGVASADLVEGDLDKVHTYTVNPKFREFWLGTNVLLTVKQKLDLWHKTQALKQETVQ